MRVLVIDDDKAIGRSLQLHLEQAGHSVSWAGNGTDGIAALEAAPFDVAFVDLRMPDISGLEVLKRIQDRGMDTLAIMITGTQDTKATIEAVRLGAFDYIRKPLDLDAILVAMEKAAHQLAKPKSKKVSKVADVAASPHEIVGAHPAIIEVIKQIGLLSRNRVPVLIQGPSGTGKELVARVLHDAGSPGEPFVAVNCSAVVSTLLESELFGHVKGAFTGADTDKVGRLELAGEGTIFLDEIGDMAPDLQSKLLRVLQEREFEPVGGLVSRPLRARVVTATHHALAERIAQGAFREDLFYRLSVATVRIPALADRRSDIPLLVQHILVRLRRELHSPVEGIEDEAVRCLQAYHWPGNVRELENVLTRAVLLTRDAVLSKENVAAAIGGRAPAADRNTGVKTLRLAEKDHVEQTLYAAGWNITKTAALLDISPTTLRKKITDYGLVPPEK